MDFQLNLIDNLSGPAKTAVGALTSLAGTSATTAGALGKMSVVAADTAKATQQLNDKFYSKAAQSFQEGLAGIGSQLAKLPGPLGAVGGMLGKLGKAITDPTGVAAAMFLLEFATMAAVGAIGLFSQGVSKVLELSKRVPEGLKWSVQVERAKSILDSLFEDVDPTEFLKATSSLLDMFGKGTPMGMLLRKVIKSLYDAFFDFAAKAVPYVKYTLQMAAITFLKVYIAAQPLIKTVGELWEKFDGGTLVMNQVAGAFQVFGAVLQFWAVGANFWLSALNNLLDLGGALANWASSATSIGQQFIDGLLAGLDFGRVTKKVQDSASSVIGSVKSVFGIKSPSTVMQGIGENLALGMAGGIGEGAPQVARAAEAMTGGAAATASIPAAPSGGGSTASFSFAPGAIVIQGAGEGAAELTVDALALAFERWAMSQGMVPA